MKWKFSLAVFCLDVFLMASGYTIMVPFLPVYLRQDLGADPETVNLWAGAVFAISFAFSALLAPFWGKMADRHGHRLMLIRSSAMICFSYLLCYLVQTPLQLLLARACMGISCGMTPAIMSMTSALVPRERLGFAMGMLQSSNVFGHVTGPLLGGTIAQYLGVRQSFLVNTMLLFVCTLLSLIVIRDPPSLKEERAHHPSPVSDLELLRRPELRCCLVCCALTWLTINLPLPVITAWVGELCQDPSRSMLLSGMVFSLSGLAGALAAPLWGLAGQRLGFFACLGAASLFSALLLFLQALPNTLLPFALLQFGVGLCTAGMVPLLNAMLAAVTCLKERGSVYGLMYSFQEIGGGLGPLAGGAMVTVLPLYSVFPAGAAVMLLLFAGLRVLAPAKIRGK